MSKKPLKTVDVYRMNPPVEGQPHNTSCVTFPGLDQDQVITRLLMEFLRWSKTMEGQGDGDHQARLNRLRNNTSGTLDLWQDLMKRPRVARESGAPADWARVVVRDNETSSAHAEDDMFVASVHIGKKKTDRLIQDALDRLHLEETNTYTARLFLNGEPSEEPGPFSFRVSYPFRRDTYSYSTREQMVLGLREFLNSHTREGGLRNDIRTALTSESSVNRYIAMAKVTSQFRKKGIQGIHITDPSQPGAKDWVLPRYCNNTLPIPASTALFGAPPAGSSATPTADTPNPEPAKEATMEETPAPSPEAAPEPELTPPKRLVQKILKETDRRCPLQQSFSIGENVIGLRWQQESSEDANLILLDLEHNHLFVDHEDPARCFNTGLNVSLLLSQVTEMPEKVTRLGGKPYSQVYVSNAQVLQRSIEALFKSANLAQVRRAVPGLSQVLGVITANAFSTGPGQASYTKTVSPGLYIQRSPGRLRILEEGKGAIEVQHSNLAHSTLTVMGTLPRLPTVGYALQSWNDVLDASPVDEAFERLRLCSSPEFQNAIGDHLGRGAGTYPGKKGMLFYDEFHAYKGGSVNLHYPEQSTSLSDLQALFEDLTDATSPNIHVTNQHRDRMLELRASLPSLVTNVPGLAESLLRLYAHKGGGTYNGGEDCMVRVGAVYLNQVSANQGRSVLQLKEQDGTGCLTLHIANEKVTQAVGDDLGKLQRALEKSYAEVAKLPTLMSQSGWNGDSSLPAAATYENLTEAEGEARDVILPVLEVAYRSGLALNRWRGEGGYLLPFGLFTEGRLTNWMGVTTPLNNLPMDTMLKFAGCEPVNTLVTRTTRGANFRHAIELLALKPASALSSLAARMLAVTPDGSSIYTYRAGNQQITLVQTRRHILLSLTGEGLQGLVYDKQTHRFQVDTGADPFQSAPVLEAMEKAGPALRSQMIEGYLPPESLRVPLSLLPESEMRTDLNELVGRQHGRVGMMLREGYTALLMDGQRQRLMSNPGAPEPLVSGDVHMLRRIAEAFTSVVSPRDLALLRSVRERGVGAYQCALLYVIPALASGRSGFFGRSVSEVVGDLHVTALSELAENGKEKMTLLLQVGSDRILSHFEKSAEGFFFTKVQYNHAARVWEAIRKIDARQLAEKLGGHGSSSPAFTQLARVIDKAAETLKYETLQAFGEAPAVVETTDSTTTAPTPEPTPQKEAQVAEAPYSHPIVRKNMMVRTPKGLVIDGDFYGYKSREDIVINPTHSFLGDVLKEYSDGVTLTEDRKLLKELCEELNLPAQARNTILSFLFAVAASLPSLTYRSFRLTDGVSTFLLLTDMAEGSLRLFVGRPEKDAYVSIEVDNDGTIFVSQRNAEILLTPGYDVAMGEVRRLLSQIVSGDAKESDNREAINHLITRAYGAVFSGTAELDIKEVLAEAIPANTPDNPVKEAEEPTPSPKEDTMAKTTDKTDSAEQAPSALTRAKEALKSDAHDAAWRTAGSQMVKLTRDPLVGLLSRHLGPDDESLRKKIADFLATEVGTALVAALLATALGVVPTTSEVPQRLARELRIKAMSDMGDLTADVLMGPLRQVIALYLQGVPEVESGSTPALPPASPSATEVLEAEGSRTSLNGTSHPVAKA